MGTLNVNQLVREAHEQKNYDPLISLIPYAKLLGIECLRLGDDMVFRLLANQDNIGNPTLPAIHGGVVGVSFSGTYQTKINEKASSDSPKIVHTHRGGSTTTAMAT